MPIVSQSKVFNSTLTTGEASFLVQELKSVIQDLEEEIAECQENIDVCWEQSIPDDYHGEFYFTYLNMYKDKKRKLKKKLAKLASIQTKLKELR